MTWRCASAFKLVEAPVSVFENYDIEKEASERVETVDEVVNDIMAKGSSGVKSNALAHDDVDTDSLGSLNDNKDKLSLASNMPPSVGEVKKEIINVEIPDTSRQIKSEPIVGSLGVAPGHAAPISDVLPVRQWHTRFPRSEFLTPKVLGCVGRLDCTSANTQVYHC